jgi:transcription elongation factor Elf1
MEELDTEFTDELTCPHCGYEHSDAWELSENDGEISCDRCSEEFSFVRNISISYTTKKL